MKKVLFMAALIGLMGCKKEQSMEKDAAPSVRRYVAILNAMSSGDPTVTILENTLGEITWTAAPNQCLYEGAHSFDLPTDKTVITFDNDYYFAMNTIDGLLLNSEGCVYGQGLNNQTITIELYP